METYTIPEAAEITGLAPREVRLALEDGRLRAIRSGGRWRIPRYELERAGMIAVRDLDASEPEPEPVPTVTRLPVPEDADTGPEEPGVAEEEVTGLHERVADLERRVEELERVASRSSREASMREALAPLFSDAPTTAPAPGEPRFPAPR